MLRLYFGKASFVFWISSRLLRHAQAQTCYYPGMDANQDKAAQQFPCDPYAYTTSCCPLGWTCFSNNLCIVTDLTAAGNLTIGTASRGPCTNPLWNDTACGDFCLDDLDDGSLQDCGSGNWCCQSFVKAGTCDCESGEGTFSLPDGKATTIIGVQGLDSTNTAIPAASTSAAASQTSSSSAPSSSSSTSSSPISTSLSTAKTSNTVTSSSKSTSFLTSGSSVQTPSSTSHTSTSTGSAAAATSTPPAVSITHKTGFKVGVSIASVIVALAIITFLVWFFWWRRRDRRPNIGAMSEADSDIYLPETGSAVPGPIMRPNPDPYEYRENNGLRLSPVGNMGNDGWSGGYSGGFAGRVTDERVRPVVDPYRMA